MVRIFVSRALDLRKMISPRIPKNIQRWSSQKKTKTKGKLKCSDSHDPWPLASGLASAGRAKRKQL